MEFKRGRYSWLLRPLLMGFDLCMINTLAFYVFNFNQQPLHFFATEKFNDAQHIYSVYASLAWLWSTAMINFYNVYRFTSVYNILSLLIKQFVLFMIIVFAFIGGFRSIDMPASTTIIYLLYSLGCIALVKLLSFYLLKTYRSYLNGNVRRVIIIGKSNAALELKHLFDTKKNLGYQLKGIFAEAKQDHNLTGNIEASFQFLKTQPGIDEIYCAIDELTENQLNAYIKHANLHHCNIKFIPKSNKLLTNRLKMDYYNYLPVLSLKDVALNNSVNVLLKRVFDVFFSLWVILFILSWLTPLLFILIKLDSKGPVLYKHKRNGINYKEFDCYKFRSLTETKEVRGTYVTQNDPRLTRIGRVLRRTSIDEFPQFYNVLKGDMSVVGPRPHMVSYTEEYATRIDKYNFMYRHNVKPGVTGLAQIKGFRGEVKTDEDIINRIKYDNFYIDNWSLVLDIKIIIQTSIQILKGSHKAY